MHRNQPDPDLPRRTITRRTIEWLSRYQRALVLRALYGAAYGASTTGASLLILWLHSRF
ncbi:hypothetical protein [Streptomyces sp. KR55]|uniref:hypothetical protein n=1 Tax=Streptomyces sp. KR55 TaxID=3457425 RepID=UPI003FD42871